MRSSGTSEMEKALMEAVLNQVPHAKAPMGLKTSTCPPQ